MTFIIGQFYDNEDDAVKRAVELQGMNLNRQRFVIVSGKQGHMVVSESAARKAWPHLFPKKPYPRYTRRNLKADTKLKKKS